MEPEPTMQPASADSAASQNEERFDPSTIVRPDEQLLAYYLIIAILTIVAFPFVFLPLYFRYRTLRYAFDEKGISMSWGVLFRRETFLTYRRIQDIHVTRNLIHRWLGLADVSIQTASGSAGAEMKIEGIRNPEKLRDFLYRQMRGVDDEPASNASGNDGETTPTAPGQPADEALVLLREIRDILRDSTGPATDVIERPPT